MAIFTFSGAFPTCIYAPIIFKIPQGTYNQIYNIFFTIFSIFVIVYFM